MRMVRCVDTGGKDFLTLDKMYAVLHESVSAYLILSDFDCEVWINKYWFKENT